MKNFFRFPRVPLGMSALGIALGLGVLIDRAVTQSVYDPKPVWYWPLAAVAMTLFVGGIVLLCWLDARRCRVPDNHSII